MAATSCEALLSGLYTVPGVRVYSDVEAETLDSVKLSCLHFDRDGAGTNDKLISNKMSDMGDRRNVLCSDRVCGNHSNNLIEISTGVGIHGGAMLAPLCCIALLFRTGSYCVRLLSGIGRFFRQCWRRSNLSA